ncbi:hypothetical protein KAK05_02620 [Candidatus Parcubacteria bacterium]|nr:hypothetical protein [Candidatus Parcubacteria bacterium]
MIKQTKDILLNGKPVTRKSIEEMIDGMNWEDIVSLMTKEQEIDWVPLIAMQAYNASTNLYPIVDDDDWFKNCKTGNRRLEFINSSIPSMIYELIKKGILTNCISAEWKSKKPDHEMYSIEYLSSSRSDTQFYMQNGGDYRFKSLADAENFLEQYLEILDIMIDGKKVKSYTKEIVIVVEKVAKRIEINW